MRIIAPVTDYIPASILTTKGDIPVRGDAIPERLAAGALNYLLHGQGAGAVPSYDEGLLRATGVKIDKDYYAATGTYAWTGVGFKPSLIAFLAVQGLANYDHFSVGFDSLTEHGCIYLDQSGQYIYSNSYSIVLVKDGSNGITGVVTALGSDGFSVTFAETGTMRANFVYICFP